MIIELAFIATEFAALTIGTKAVDPPAFWAFLEEGLRQFELAGGDKSGHYTIELPAEAFRTVSAGVGLRTNNPEDYVTRLYRGQVGAYLRREFASSVEGLAVVVYTVKAYLADPDVSPEEAERILAAGATHVLVTVLASAGPRSPLTPWRFAKNLAGGNSKALAWSADEIRAKAGEVASWPINYFSLLGVC